MSVYSTKMNRILLKSGGKNVIYRNLTLVNPSSDKSITFPTVMVILLCDLNIISRMSLLSLGFKSYHIDLYAASPIILLWRSVAKMSRCQNETNV